MGLILAARAFEACGWSSGDCGEGIGEYVFSEKLVLDEIGDVLPPHPKNEPSFEPPGDFCGDL